MIWAVVMAGGTGTRFWPLSRQRRPKQFLPIVTRRTMIGETVRRLVPWIPAGRILVVTHASHARWVRKELPRIPPRNILMEPCSRNTAPCLGLAALHLEKRDPKATFVALPADHFIANVPVFRRQLALGCELAAENRHVVFGIPPRVPHTGYGYMECARPSTFRRGGSQLFRGRRFIEKPSHARAVRFIRSGRFFWNSGMFVWSLPFFLRTIAKALPELNKVLRKLKPYVGTREEWAALSRIYPFMPDVSIDHGLMEKVKNLSVIKTRFGWNDVGGWRELGSLSKQDSLGNMRVGKTILLDSRDNIVQGSKRLIALVGVNDLIVVDSPDALLVCDKARSQDVKKVVEALRRRKLSSYL